jgi:hypothetical protein
MPIASESAFARGSRVVYEALLIFYPPDVRRRFGAEMAEVFEALMHDAVIEHGLRGTVSLWRSALWELLTVALPLRLASNAVMAGAISLLVSSALFLVLFRAVT